MTYKIDRTGWPSGEWDDEPDYEEFIHNNLRCVIRRTYMGALCGYVIVPNDHPSYTVSSDDLVVHGGVTFDERVSLLELKPIEQMGFTNVEGTRIIGFNCHHYDDLVPGTSFAVSYGCYRNAEYVKDEVISLCEQIDQYGYNETE